MKKSKADHLNIKCQNCPAKNKSTFCLCSANDTHPIDNLKELVAFGKKETLSLHNGREHGFYCIRSGYLTLSTSATDGLSVLRVCGPGDLVAFGHLDSSINYSISTITHGEACFFPFESFTNVSCYSTTIQRGIWNKLSEIIYLKDKKIFGLEKISVKARVSSALLCLVEKFGKSTPNGILITVPIDRKTLASISSTGIESLSRVLTELESDNVIKREKDYSLLSTHLNCKVK